VRDVALGVYHVENGLRKFENRYLVGTAEIEHLAASDRSAGVSDGSNPSNKIVHVAKRARLASVTVHGQVVAPERL